MILRLSDARYKPVADRAVLVELASEQSDEVNRAVIALDHAIASAGIDGVVEVVPALVNLLVIFDPLQTDHAQVQDAVSNLFPLEVGAQDGSTEHIVDVCYEGYCPDLAAVAQASGLSPDAVINAHLGSEYRVCMYGFAPGYAYMSGVAPEIQVPRKQAPVRDIPAGSVMIAGPQCLVTTLVMPTGWSIIGRSPAQIMRDDPARPFLFDVGDTIRFRRISEDAL